MNRVESLAVDSNTGEDKTLVARRGHLGEGRDLGPTLWPMLDIPHVVILPEECVIFYSPLLQLHIQAAPVDRHHLADTAGPQSCVSCNGNSPCPSAPVYGGEGKGPTE